LDRGPQFITEFMQELYHMLDIVISSSTAYHPQTDGQTERVNQELEQYLRVFISERQDNWAELLPMVEFQHNNHVHSATQTTPFLLDSGCALRMGFEPHTPSQVEAVNKFVKCMKSAMEEACSAINKSKDDMAHYYNCCQTPAPEFKPGDKVFLDASDIWTNRPLQKLAHKYLSLFPVIERIG
jgi:hypothetical protein